MTARAGAALPVRRERPQRGAVTAEESRLFEGSRNSGRMILKEGRLSSLGWL